MAEQHEHHGGHAHHSSPPEAGQAAFQLGEHVWANFGAGKVIGHLGDLGHEVDGADGSEIKFKVLNPATGRFEDLGYREPDGPDADTGRTFWSLD